MRYRTTEDTDWHDGEEVITVLAGELVEVVHLGEIPEDMGRRDIEDGIEAHRKQGEHFVPVSIRDWFGLMELQTLEAVTTGPIPQLAKSKLKPLEVPGLRGRKSAPCATE